jgi:hypothetical protein
MVLLMIIYYGLLLMIVIAFAVHLYDYYFNGEPLFEGFFGYSSEFRSGRDIDSQKLREEGTHQGHNHMQMPVDMTNI